MQPRILFLSRPSALKDLTAALSARSLEVFQDSFSHGYKQPQAFRLNRWRDLARAVRGGEFDLVIALSQHGPLWRNNVSSARNLSRVAVTLLRRSSSLGLRLLLPSIRASGLPLAILDDDDSLPLAHRNWPLLDAATRYFKINTPIDLKHAYLYQDERTGTPHNIGNVLFAQKTISKIRPCSLGFNVKFTEMTSRLSTEPKLADIFFAGSLSYSHYRQTALPHLLALRDEGIRVDYPTERLAPEEFARRCAQAHLTWSPPGGGWECFRTYEAPFAHSVPITCYPNIQRYQPLRQNEHILFYSAEGEGLKQGVREALQRKGGLPTLAADARDFILRHHHPDRLVDYIVQETLNAPPG